MKYDVKAVRAAVARLIRAGYTVEFERRKEDDVAAIAGNQDTGVVIEIFRDGSTSDGESKEQSP